MTPERAPPATIDPPAQSAAQAAWQRTYGGQSAPDKLADPSVLPCRPSDGGTEPSPARRSQSDRQAAWRRWHSTECEPTLTERESAWYQLFEQARVEELASRDLPGMALNLGALETLTPQGAQQAHLYRLARQLFAEDVPEASTRSDAGPVRVHEATVSDAATPAAESLATSTRPSQPADPATSNPLPPNSQGWLNRFLSLRRPQPVSTPSLGPSPTHEETLTALLQARTYLREGPAFAAVLLPLIQRLARTAESFSPDDFSPGEPCPTDSPQEILDPHDTTDPGKRAQNLPEPGVDDEEENEATEPHDDPPPGEAGGQGTYRAYSTQWDEERPAQTLCTPADHTALQALDPGDQARIRRLALRLQRRLLSARQRHWQFDQESGRLDSRRLARLLTPGASPRIFREEDVSPVPEACVTLLVDQSGSMRGRPQQMAVQTIDLAIQTLEACRITCEVLGYTTPAGEDNPVSRAWRAHGQPSQPGRLNALRHLIYKSARQPWPRCRQSLGLMLRADFGRENLDGEALDWAARRLTKRPEPRKILLVLSDAAPYDAATVTVHGRAYLASHLRDVIARIDASPIQLVAIGTTHAVGYYYRQALIINRTDSLADTLFAQLEHLLTLPAIDRRP
jgi:cobaltochelatase CobT